MKMRFSTSICIYCTADAVKRSARSPSGASGGFERGYIPLAGEWSALSLRKLATSRHLM